VINRFLNFDLRDVPMHRPAAQQGLKGKWPWKIANAVLSFSFGGLLVTFGCGVTALPGWLVFSFGRLREP
jgi:hypothetical protein